MGGEEEGGGEEGGYGELGKINPNIREKAMWPQGKHFFLNLNYVALEVQLDLQ